MTRHDPAESGAGSGVGTHDHDTRTHRPSSALEAVTGTVVRITPDMDELAADLADRIGDAAAAALALALTERAVTK